MEAKKMGWTFEKGRAGRVQGCRHRRMPNQRMDLWKRWSPFCPTFAAALSCAHKTKACRIFRMLAQEGDSMNNGCAFEEEGLAWGPLKSHLLLLTSARHTTHC
eukprot:1159264-Pelagomonas_calceolata.AAC.2